MNTSRRTRFLPAVAYLALLPFARLPAAADPIDAAASADSKKLAEAAKSQLTAHDRALREILDASVKKMETGNAAEALKDADRALAMDALISHAWAQRGVVRLALQDWPGAVADATRALDMNLKLAVVYNIRSRALLESARPQDALADAEQALALEPRNAQAYLNRAKAREALGYGSDIFLTDYRSAADNDPALKDDLNEALARVYPQGIPISQNPALRGPIGEALRVPLLGRLARHWKLAAAALLAAVAGLAVLGRTRKGEKTSG